MDGITHAAFEAISRGYQAIPLRPRDKIPSAPAWTHIRWDDGTTPQQVEKRFAEEWHHDPSVKEESRNVGVLLGEPSLNLIDIDLDHYKTSRLKDYFLPPTPAVSGRAGKHRSHYWYIAAEGTLPGTRQHLMERSPEGKRGDVIVELRSTGAQTAIPSSVHPSGEAYVWHGEPWGGDAGPAVVDGRRLAAQVALLALTTLLLEHWPRKGTRHEAYVALAGGLLRDGDHGVHAFWGERGNASVLIRALAEATMDEDGPDSRESESVGPTIRNLLQGNKVMGFGKLAEILGDEVVKQARLLIGEVESAAGVTPRQAPTIDIDAATVKRDEALTTIADEDRDPLEERLGSWEPVDIDPYLSGRVKPVEPSVMQRSDGQYLMYPGRVNMLYGSSESAKSWIALHTCLQLMAGGERVMFLDMEDEPVNTLDRLRRLGAQPDDLRFLFSYVRPEEPLEPMQRDRWGGSHVTEGGKRNQELFQAAMDRIDPSLIVVDGMTVLYGLHGLDSNDAVSTDIITGWLKKLTRNGRSTVIIIDHTSKGAERGSTPIGSQHKQAMVQGAMLQVYAVKQPMPGAVGEVELIVLKDRIGEVRKASASSGGSKVQSAARVVIDSTVGDTTVIDIQPPQSGAQVSSSGVIDLRRSRDAAKAQQMREEERQVLQLYGGDLGKEMSLMQVLVGLGHAQVGDTQQQMPQKVLEKWRAVLLRLVTDGWLDASGNTKGRTYVLLIGGAGYDDSVDLGTQPDDDSSQDDAQPGDTVLDLTSTAADDLLGGD